MILKIALVLNSILYELFLKNFMIQTAAINIYSGLNLRLTTSWLQNILTAVPLDVVKFQRRRITISVLLTLAYYYEYYVTKSMICF